LRLSPENPVVGGGLIAYGEGRRWGDEMLFVLSNDDGTVAQRAVQAGENGSYSVKFNEYDKPGRYTVLAYLITRAGEGLIFLDRKTVEVQDAGNY
jgi:hypothetical protein